MNPSTNPSMIHEPLHDPHHKQDKNQVVIWDDIVLSKADAVIDRRSLRGEYPMTHIRRTLR